MKVDDNAKRKKNLTTVSISNKNTNFMDKKDSKDGRFISQEKINKDIFDLKKISVSNFSTRCHDKDRYYQKASPVSKKLEFDSHVFENKFLKRKFSDEQNNFMASSNSLTVTNKDTTGKFIRHPAKDALNLFNKKKKTAPVLSKDLESFKKTKEFKCASTANLHMMHNLVDFKPNSIKEKPSFKLNLDAVFKNKKLTSYTERKTAGENSSLMLETKLNTNVRPISNSFRNKQKLSTVTLINEPNLEKKLKTCRSKHDDPHKNDTEYFLEKKLTKNPNSKSSLKNSVSNLNSKSVIQINKRQKKSVLKTSANEKNFKKKKNISKIENFVKNVNKVDNFGKKIKDFPQGEIIIDNSGNFMFTDSEKKFLSTITKTNVKNSSNKKHFANSAKSKGTTIAHSKSEKNLGVARYEKNSIASPKIIKKGDTNKKTSTIMFDPK